MALLAHFLIAGVPTVAAVNGHCFAGGFLLALSHDYRIMRYGRFHSYRRHQPQRTHTRPAWYTPLIIVMDIVREDRGFCCLNEVDIGLNLCPGMAAVARAKLER